MTSDAGVRFAVDDRVGIITLEQPERLNAMSAPMASTLLGMLQKLRYDDDVRVLVLTGAGRAFCAGADLAQEGERRPTGAERRSPVGAYGAVTKAIVEVDKPVIAAIPGVAVGAGLSYALACDRRIGDTNTRMSAIFVKRGLHPDCGASFFLPKLVGLPMALHMVTTGVMLDAAACKAAGLLDELVPEGEALPRALAYARQLASGPSVVVDLARRAIYQSLSSTLEQMLYYEAFAVGIAGQTADRVEGFKAFAERREPRFTGA
jgi:2-(1,2-epoxy-1,2-dihydrophenyl)acetyl-CoA isomerase